MPKFSVKAATVEAVQYTGTNANEVYAFGGSKISLHGRTSQLGGLTPSGLIAARRGDWIVKNTRGDLSVVADEAFTMGHELVG